MANTSGFFKSPWKVALILVLAGNCQALWAQPESEVPARLPEILIDARLIEIDRTGLREPLPPQSASAIVGGLIESGFAIGVSDSVAQSLVTSPRARVLQRFQFTVTNRTPSQSRIGSRIPLTAESSEQKQAANNGSAAQPEYLDAGLHFEVTPELSSNGEVFFIVSAEVLIRRGYTNGGDLPEPVFKSQRIRHGSRLTAGQTLLIGGFITEEEAKTLITIPALTDSPVLRYLFRQRDGHEQSEIVVLLTPHIPNALLSAVQPPAPTPAPAPIPTPTPEPTPVPPPASIPEPAVVETPRVPARPLYTVQVGAFRDETAASALVNTLAPRYGDVFIQPPNGSDMLYRVRVSRFADPNAARRLENQLRNDGFDAFIARLDSGTLAR